MAPGVGRDFNCSWEHCGKSFNRKSDLCRHYRIHTNERPYHCTVKDCNKSFIQRSALTVHSRTHTGEKPHVCDHEGCHKAFSDSSSLARHRRIHTGKRPYICQEPTCERSFCRKTTLTKHQHRSHPPGTMTRPPSEDAMSEQSYQAPVAAPIPNDQYLLAQQQYYHQPSTPSQDFYPQQSLPVTHIPVHDTPPMMSQNIPVTSPLDVQHAQQQYMQQLMQQRYDTTQQSYMPPGYQQQQQQQQTFVAQPMAEGHPLMISYNPNFHYKQPTRILNQPEGTDWGFLGVG
ncbi:isoform 3 of zinc finger protein 143 [Aspergillus udagawae]|nr:isoform 3 of zinc finger protein 143 [Aspergillus udagawae]GFG01290.1 isoform 3 of zinc finger protein 143 [Aspergillus udagawae]